MLTAVDNLPSNEDSDEPFTSDDDDEAPHGQCDEQRQQIEKEDFKGLVWDNCCCAWQCMVFAE